MERWGVGQGFLEGLKETEKLGMDKGALTALATYPSMSPLWSRETVSEWGR